VSWVLPAPSELEKQTFGSMDASLGVPGETLNSNLMSSLRKAKVGDRVYYLKIYHSRGKWLRRYLGRSRVQSEWQNLRLFEQLAVPTARVVGYGERGQQGLLITEELPGTIDLAALARKPACFAQLDVAAVIDQLSGYVRTLHRHGFVHNDLKWRNILVAHGDRNRFQDNASPEVMPNKSAVDNELDVYIIDCPQGRRLLGPMLTRGIVKDLACLDKVAKYRLSRTQRLRFYLKYRELDRLYAREKREIVRILRFFEGRE
jgi:tRNA A-37 threonylcarbamoyl transferase component Bud32